MTIILTDDLIKEINSRIEEGFNLWAYDFNECCELSELSRSLEEGKTEIEIVDDLSNQTGEIVSDVISTVYNECVLYNVPDLEIHFKFTVIDNSLAVDAHFALGRMGGRIDQLEPIAVLNGEMIYDLDEYLSYEYDESEIEIEKENLISQLKEASDVDLASIRTSFEVAL